MNTTKRHTFRKELTKLINRESMENNSDTPDFLLAEYLTDCLAAFDRVVVAREKWYGREPEPVCPQPDMPIERIKCEDPTCGCEELAGVERIERHHEVLQARAMAQANHNVPPPPPPNF